jgi:hypothetical protein
MVHHRDGADLMTGVAGGLLIGSSSSAYVYLTETDDWATACTTPPSTARKQRVDGMIRNLQSAGIWSTLDWLVLFAAETAQAGLVNVRVPAKVATWAPGTGTPGFFTADRGYTGNDVDAYISLAESISAGGNFALDDAARGVWCTQVGGTGTKYQLGTSSARAQLVARNNAGNETFNINDSTTGTVFQGNTGSRSGHRAISRVTSTNKAGYFNGAKVADLAVASTTLAAGTAYILRQQSSYGSDQANAYWHGAGMDDTEHAAMDSILGEYLTAVGAI